MKAKLDAAKKGRLVVFHCEVPGCTRELEVRADEIAIANGWQVDGDNFRCPLHVARDGAVTGAET